MLFYFRRPSALLNANLFVFSSFLFYLLFIFFIRLPKPNSSRSPMVVCVCYGFAPESHSILFLSLFSWRFFPLALLYIFFCPIPFRAFVLFHLIGYDFTLVIIIFCFLFVVRVAQRSFTDNKFSLFFSFSLTYISFQAIDSAARLFALVCQVHQCVCVPHTYIGTT